MLSEVFAAAADIQNFCLGQRWQFCFIGGVAVQRWGEPRFTHDADLTLLTGFGNERHFIDPLLVGFDARRADAAEFAERYRVLLLQHPNGIPIDIALGALPFEEATITRRTLWRHESGFEL